MRPLVLDLGVLRATARDLDAAGTDTASVLRAVEAPSAGYAWHQLVDRGVTTLLDDSATLARACRNIAEALEEAIADVEATDFRAADAARGLL